MRYRLPTILANAIKVMTVFYVLMWSLIFAQDSDFDVEDVENNPLSYELTTRFLDASTPCEKTQGPFASELGDQLLNLGKYYQNHDANDDAIGALECARHVITINDGQESLKLIPVLDELIHAYTSVKNWDEMDRNIMDMYFIYQQYLDRNDAALLKIIDQARSWKLSVYNNKLLSTSLIDTVNEIIELSKSKIEIQEALYGESDPRLIISFKELALAQYEKIRQLINVPIERFSGTENTLVSRSECMETGRGIVCYQREVPNPIYMADRQGNKNNSMMSNMQPVKDTLLRIKGIYESNGRHPLKDYVLSLLDLGDWSLINQQSTKAYEYYKQSYELLQNNISGAEALDELFGKPILIPAVDINVFNNTSSSGVTQTIPYVKLTFDVTKEGKTRRIKIIEQNNPDNFKARKVAKDTMKSMMFRPRIVDGSPVLTSKMEYTLSGSFLN